VAVPTVGAQQPFAATQPSPASGRPKTVAPVGSRSATTSPSQQPLPSLPAEVTLDLICPPDQIAVAFVLQDLMAIEGILKAFQLLLQTLDLRLQRLQPLIRFTVWRSRA
jgi:hypothetical protein